ncbi:glycosyltransferase [Accumulibacter sp.]|uniref:glycosyltransferase n=1 Tax=Accumulibacter sp. TaxID=2053492 RepID=UPI0026142872|nr:glycosyltransferase [Accumulibacter sp.]HMW63747.1 glycosyltransferase [Accumulibacter sp.]HNH93206.1 glycosyltransferase [Accumulibacter sp.]
MTLRLRSQTLRNVMAYWQLRGARATLQHALSEIAKMRRRQPDKSFASIVGGELFDRDRTVAFDHEPRVSIIICNLDGLPHLPALCDALTAQSYTNFEIVFVDNASTDGSPDYLRERFPTAKLIRLTRNLGFAAANNVGYLAAVGELVAFLNNDTVPHEDWLAELVSELRRRPFAGSAVPKVLFNRFFSRLTITCTEQASLSATTLLDSLDYRKVFVDEHELNSEEDIAINASLTLVLPQQENPVIFEFRSAGELARVRIQREQRTVASGYTSRDTHLRLEIANSWRSVAHWYRVINNAGSTSHRIFATADRGYGEIDASQYDRRTVVDYMCGCAALVRRSALGAELPFREEFFAYFEDSELSLRLRRRRFPILYVPRSVVLHTHSATASTNSTFRSYLIKRNRLIFMYHRVPVALRRALLILAVLREHGTDRRRKTLRLARRVFQLYALARDPKLLAGECNDQALRDALLLVANAPVPTVPRKRVCIYNDYWNSCGGGEAHALEFARYFMDKGIELTLASKSSIDVARLSMLFNIDLQTVLLFTKPDFCSADTQHFDLFINSTYQSTLVSRAPYSMFIVSFPSRKSSKAFRSSYFFAFNSDFTRDWSSRFWGETNGAVIEPVVREIGMAADLSAKRNLILNVGRFSNRGHAKNQHVIARAFIAALEANPAANWHLVLAGTLDQTSRVDVEYFGKLLETSAGYPISLVEGAEKRDIAALYAQAKVYVHAAGLGVDSEERPELSEHFGMTVAEAIHAACYVIVHNSGNPPFMVQKHGFGSTYQSEGELTRMLAEMIGKNDLTVDRPPRPGCEKAFAPEVFTRKLAAALQSIGFTP